MSINQKNAKLHGYDAKKIAEEISHEQNELRKARQRGDHIRTRIALVNIQALTELGEKLARARSTPKPKDKPINTSTARKQQNVHKYSSAALRDGDDSGKKSDTLKRVMKR
jgi:hypothetical protein